MINSVKARTPILALILFVFAVGYTFAANKVVVIPMGADAAQQSFAVFESGEQAKPVGNTAEFIRTVSLTAPTDGVVIVNSTVQLVEDTAGDGGQCSISKALLPIIDTAHQQAWESSGFGNGGAGQLAGTRGFNVSAGTGYAFKLVCVHLGAGTTAFRDSSLTATFTPSP